MDFYLHHRTHYLYDRPVFLNPHTIRLRPAASSAAEIIDYRLRVWPEPVQLGWQLDPWSNRVAQVSFAAQTQQLTLHVNFRGKIGYSNPFNFVIEPWATRFPFAYPEPMRLALEPCLGVSEPLEQVVEAWRQPGPTLNLLLQVNGWIPKNLRYLERDAPGVQSAEETLRLGQGTCRDFAWLAIAMFRQLGLAARFVSGYLVPQLTAGDRVDRVGGGELHAWAEIFLPGAGWVGIDPTSGLLASATHIALACAPGPDGTAPLEGNLGYSGETPKVMNFSHHVSIRT